MLKKIVLIFINLSLFLSSILPLSANAESEISVRIIGGTKATQGDWPFMTAVILKDRDAFQGQYCGASFIGGRYVLTAAHCVTRRSADSIDVSIGIYNLNNEDTEGERVGVQAIYTDGYDPKTHSNDIAILELEKEVTATKIELATKTLVDSLTSGDQLTVMGWGILSTTTASYPHDLYQVDVPYVDRSTCQNIGGNYSTIGNDTICAGFQEGGKDSCQGDSGGPLIYDDNGTYKQVGIVSRGNGCAQPNAYGVYTNVGYFTNNNWITEKTNGVSYTQHTYLPETEISPVSITLPIRNYGTEAFDVTNITLSAGLTMTNNTCTTTLNQNDSCELRVQADIATISATSVPSEIIVTTNHSQSTELKMDVTVIKVPSSSSGGGASLGLGVLAFFGLGLRRKRG